MQPRGARATVGGDRWRAVLPGWPQWRRGQRSRAAVLLGSFASALAVALFAWGSGLGAVLLGFAMLVHAASAADAIRQASFPGFGTWAPWFSATLGLGAGGYAPALAVALQFAYPAWTPEGGFLVNRAAFAEQGPGPGHWVWLERDGPGRPRVVARVVAIGGQEVSWSESGLLVDGRASAVAGAAAGLDRRSSGKFEVPEGTLLVSWPASGGGAVAPGGRPASVPLAIVPADRAIGRPWARSYPLWRRRLLS